MMKDKQFSKNSKLIHASPERLYHAFTDPGALSVWLAPGDMHGKIHHFDLRVGGGYEMSLFYPDDDKQSQGKTTGKEDRFVARFVELQPNKKIVQAINFNSDDDSFKGEMIMETLFEPKGNSTEVTIIFTNIPPGIRPEDNEAGTEASLDKLAKYIGR